MAHRVRVAPAAQSRKLVGVATMTIQGFNQNYIIQSEPKVISVDHYEFVDRCGNVVGTVNATFDFSDLPTSQHQMLLQMIQKDRRSIWGVCR